MENVVPDLQYRLNARDEITAVSQEWLAFARANDGEFLLPPAVLGRSLWEFIQDLETRHIYRVLHRKVRARGAAVRLSFRCDGPGCRRLLELDIVPDGDQALVYRVRTVKQVDRVAVPLLARGQPRSATFVTMCGWCNRVAAPSHGWLEVAEAIAALALFDEPLPPQLTHGICPECGAVLRQGLDDDVVRLDLGTL